MLRTTVATQKLQPEKTFLKHADGSRPRVLYAEDSTASRVVTTAMLKRMGLDVDAVEDGELALRQAEKSSYDVILLDIEMPIMDGVTAARGIRALGGHSSNTPILALSAFLADSTEVSDWRDAFDHALPKPANGNELHRAISGVLLPRHNGFSGAIAKEPVLIHLTDEVSVATGLRAGLPKGTWENMQRMAAAESVHYANAASVAVSANDVETLRHCIHALLGLARNFEAPEIEQLASDIAGSGPDTRNIGMLLVLATEWHNSTKY
jgi:CheY-like chemotaxis protein